MKCSPVEDQVGPRCPPLHDEVVRLLEVLLTAVVEGDREEHLDAARNESVPDDHALGRAEPGAVRAYWGVHPHGLVDDRIKKLHADEIAVPEPTSLGVYLLQFLPKT